MISNRLIDHLVYCVPDLEIAIDYMEAKLGVRASLGGKHTNQGTKNALINLGNKCYLEIIAVDVENKSVTGNRWMGIDYIEEPRLTRWALKTTDIVSDQMTLTAYNAELGQIKEGSRLTPSGMSLSWKMTTPLSHPEIEPVPFLVDWTDSASHPTDGLEQSCALVEFLNQFPEGEFKTQNCLRKLHAPCTINVASEPKLNAIISGPKGNILI